MGSKNGKVWTKPGVLRDDSGHLIMAFSVATQCRSNNQAEAMPALYVIECCNRALDKTNTI
uniref:RNase H type-1 domain-containing protein n=1 Tax=Solanum lycopersicum TaxID=4081 RepID=A0A3Q7HLN1_SOLLC